MGERLDDSIERESINKTHSINEAQPEESARQCCLAYRKFVREYPQYYVDVTLCAFSSSEMSAVENVLKNNNQR